MRGTILERSSMDRSRFTVLQAASRILNEQCSDGTPVEVVSAYAKTNIPEKANLPDDELAAVVALKLLDIEGDPANKSK
jgi:hypothetical protein